MAQSFSATIDAWALKSERRIQAVMQESAQRVIEVAQTPVAKGGRLRLDTGFLRASGQATLGSAPGGVVANPFTKPNSAGEPADVALVIVGFTGDESLFFTYSANYARIREAYDGFVAGAAADWGSIVKKVVAEAKRRFP